VLQDCGTEVLTLLLLSAEGCEPVKLQQLSLHCHGAEEGVGGHGGWCDGGGEGDGGHDGGGGAEGT